MPGLSRHARQTQFTVVAALRAARAAGLLGADQAGPVLGWTSAIAAYGAYLIPKIFATQIKAGTPEYALYGFAFYYGSCLLVNWWFYARKGAEVPC